MLGDFASLDVQNTYRGSDAYVLLLDVVFFFEFCYMLINLVDNRLHKDMCIFFQCFFSYRIKLMITFIV
ncbi:hypothetical protein [Piscirickettsia salmonis]|uniref:hypothetical protein n=1 Tax=Piscirickettsia salmonis TaxID=1238 RepID=UPI00386B9D89